MGKSFKKSASKIVATGVVAPPTEPLKKGKRHAEDAIEKEVVSAKQQKLQPNTPATPKERTTASKTLFVGNLPFSVEQADVENFFKAAGEIVDVRFATKSNNSFRGFGHVEFSSAEAAEKALRELNGQCLLGRPVRLDTAGGRGKYTPYSSRQKLRERGRAQGCEDWAKTPATPKEQITGSKILFVGNLPFSVEKADVENFFKAAGDIVDVRFAMKPDNSFRGCGHVEFSSAEAADKALRELNGQYLMGRPVRLDPARERGQCAPHSGSKDTLPFQEGGRARGRQDRSTPVPKKNHLAGSLPLSCWHSTPVSKNSSSDESSSEEDVYISSEEEEEKPSRTP